MPLADDIVKYGGIVLGAIGTTVSIINAVKAKDRYHATVRLYPGASEGPKRGVIVGVTNTGNKAFSVSRAFYRQHGVTIGDKEYQRSVSAVFYTPSPEKIVYLQPGQTATLGFSFNEEHVSPEEVTVVIHNGHAFQALDSTLILSPDRVAYVLARAIEQAIDGWEAHVINEKKLHIFKLPRNSGESRPLPLLLPTKHKVPIMHVPTREGVRLHGEDPDVTAQKWQFLMAMAKRLPMLIEHRDDGVTQIVMWNDRVIGLNDDPTCLQALAAELGVDTDSLSSLGHRDDREKARLLKIFLRIGLVLSTGRRRRRFHERLRVLGM